MNETYLDVAVRFVDAVAWPLTVFVILVLFRKPIVRMFSRLVQLTYKDVSVSFGQELTAAEVQVKEIVSTAKHEPMTATPREDKRSAEPSRSHDIILRLLAISPRSAILMAWSEVELAIMAAGKQRGIDRTHSRKAVSEIVAELVKQSYIHDRFLGFYTHLYNMRNKAFHSDDNDLSLDEAARYTKIALDLIDKLESLPY